LLSFFKPTPSNTSLKLQMTRSEQSSYSPNAAKKVFKANAKNAGMSIEVAIKTRADLLATKKIPKPVGNIRRNPGRMDGVSWNGSSFICAQKVDDGTPPREEDVDDHATDFDDTTREQTTDNRMVVSLLDIARPVKPKGVAKEFEIVDGVQRVIALEDEDEVTEHSELGVDEEWEEIYGDSHLRERISYSAVLRGNER